MCSSCWGWAFLLGLCSLTDSLETSFSFYALEWFTQRCADPSLRDLVACEGRHLHLLLPFGKRVLVTQVILLPLQLVQQDSFSGADHGPQRCRLPGPRVDPPSLLLNLPAGQAYKRSRGKGHSKAGWAARPRAQRLDLEGEFLQAGVGEGAAAEVGWAPGTLLSPPSLSEPAREEFSQKTVSVPGPAPDLSL